MTRLLFAVMALGLTIPAFSQTPGRKVALLIGVQKYDGTGLNNLKFAEKDMTDLGASLTKLGYQITLVTKSEYKRTDLGYLDPIAENIRDQLKAVTRNRNQEDTILVAFSGHGVHLKSTNKFYVCPANCNLEKPETLVAVDDVMATLGQCKAGSKVLLVDACRNDPTDGKAATDGRLESQTRPLIPDPPGGTVALFSCSKGQISHESETFQHGFMTHFVIDGLNGKAANKTGVIGWDQLVAHVKDEVPDAVTSQKGPNSVQRPESFGKANILAIGKIARLDFQAGEERSFEIASGMSMVFCWIPPGECHLGSPKNERQAVLAAASLTEEPEWLKLEAEEVRGKYKSKGYWLGKTPVTQAEWIAVMGTKPERIYFRKDGPGANNVRGLETSRFPAESVSWHDARSFLSELNKRDGVARTFGRAGSFVLPHEDQWEYAARAGLGNRKVFFWGDSLNGGEANCNGAFPFGTTRKGDFLNRTSAVGSYAARVPHPWGLCDLHGNVYQWCDNQYGNDDRFRCLRGGSWLTRPDECRTARRFGWEPQSRQFHYGFRICLNPE